MERGEPLINQPIWCSNIVIDYIYSHRLYKYSYRLHIYSNRPMYIVIDYIHIVITIYIK